jgi:hypothetical protein
MSPLRPTSNVYVLPALSAETPSLRPRPRLSMRLRALAWWWRLRLTVREVADALRRFGRPRSRVERDDLGLDAEPIAVGYSFSQGLALTASVAGVLIFGILSAPFLNAAVQASATLGH